MPKKGRRQSKKPVPEPRKLTPELQAKLCRLIAAGATYELACGNCRIDRKTYYNWRQLAKDDHRPWQNRNWSRRPCNAWRKRCRTRVIETCSKELLDQGLERAVQRLKEYVQFQPDRFSPQYLRSISSADAESSAVLAQIADIAWIETRYALGNRRGPEADSNETADVLTRSSLSACYEVSDKTDPAVFDSLRQKFTRSGALFSGGLLASLVGGPNIFVSLEPFKLRGFNA